MYFLSLSLRLTFFSLLLSLLSISLLSLFCSNWIGWIAAESVMSKLLSPSSHHHHLNGHGHNHHHPHHNPMSTNKTMTKVLRSVSNRQLAASQQPLITDFLPCIKSSASSISSSGSSGTTKSSSSSTNVSNGRCSSRLANRKKSQETEELRKVCICSKIDPPGFVIKHFGPAKGRGVVARKTLKKGDFVCEYSGDLIDVKEAKVSFDIHCRKRFPILEYFSYD